VVEEEEEEAEAPKVGRVYLFIRFPSNSHLLNTTLCSLSTGF